MTHLKTLSVHPSSSERKQHRFPPQLSLLLLLPSSLPHLLLVINWPILTDSSDMLYNIIKTERSEIFSHDFFTNFVCPYSSVLEIERAPSPNPLPSLQLPLFLLSLSHRNRRISRRCASISHCQDILVLICGPCTNNFLQFPATL